MVELGFGDGSNPTPPTQTHIPPSPTDPTLPNPIYTPSPTTSPNPTLPFPTLSNPHPTPSQPTPSTTYPYLYPTLPYSARHWVKHGMDWNGMEFYHEFFKGTFSIYLQPPPHNKPHRPSDPNSPDLDPHPPDHDPLPQTLTS